MNRETINENISSYFDKLCTVQTPTETVDTFGDSVYSWNDTYIDVEAALSSNESGNEIFSSREVTILYSHIIALNGVYVVDETMRAVLGADVYDVIQVVYDQLNAFTMLRVEKRI